jgi:hypothetical protein
MTKGLLAVAGFALAFDPTSVLACPACYASLGTRLLNTYYLSTAFLSLLPFAIIIGLVAVGRHLRRRFSDLPVQEGWSPQR